MIETKRPYSIKFIGLKVGIHTFSFELGKAFFDQFDHSEINDASLIAEVELEKLNNMMIFNFDIRGSVSSLCDLCQDPITVDLEFKEKLISKFGDETGNTDDEILVIGPAEFEIDMSQFFYEYSHLALPSKKTHKNEADCNQDVLKLLDSYMFKDDNEDQSTDPRWDQLKNLKK